MFSTTGKGKNRSEFKETLASFAQPDKTGLVLFNDVRVEGEPIELAGPCQLASMGSGAELLAYAFCMIKKTEAYWSLVRSKFLISRSADLIAVLICLLGSSTFRNLSSCSFRGV